MTTNKMNSTIEFCQNSNYFETWLNNHGSNINQMYMSIGSKHNFPIVDFGILRNNQVQFCSNSAYQMLPIFIRNSYVETKKNLVVVVDDFHNTQRLEENIQLLTSEIDGHSIQNTHILLFDYVIRPENIETLCDPFLKCAESMKLHTKNVKIANFIVFQRPNAQEYHLEQKIPSIMMEILKNHTNGKYVDSFYQWYGYMFYYYDYLYPYQKYHTSKLQNMIPIQKQLLEKKIYASQLDPFDYDKIDAFAKNDKGDLYDAWKYFKKHTIHLVNSLEE